LVFAPIMGEATMARDSETRIRIVEVAQTDPLQLSAFFYEAFGPVRARFLMNHGDWWHGGSGGRFVAMCDDTVAGYRGIIPSACLLDGKELRAIWGVDLFVLPRFRGLGLQKLLDQRLLDASDLIMSFPGDLGAMIYAKQGYGVRQELQVLSMSLAPDPLAQTTPGLGGLVKHVVARGQALGFRGTARQVVRRTRGLSSRAQTAHYRSRHAERVDSPDPEALESLFRRYVASDLMTTMRSAEHLRWRYLDAPYRSELEFYLSDSNGKSNHCAVVRFLDFTLEARILDVFGNLADEEGIADLLRTILRDAAHRGVERISVQSSLPSFSNTLCNVGFTPDYMRRFRWFSHTPKVHERLSTAPLYWVLGDSDSDRPH
jgi:GNAT superfamily N-acetyltransferase